MGLNIRAQQHAIRRASRCDCRGSLTRDEAIDALRAVAEGSDITLTEEETVIRGRSAADTGAGRDSLRRNQLAQARESRARPAMPYGSSIRRPRTSPMLANLLTGAAAQVEHRRPDAAP